MTISASSFVRLSTDQFCERDRIEASREVFGRAIMNIEFEPAPGVAFHMDMVLRALPDFGLAAGTRSAMACVRSKPLIDSDDLLIAYMRSGSGFFQFGGREAHIDAGGATILRTSSEGRLCLPSTADMVTYRLPVSRIAPLIDDLDAALVRPIPADSEPLRLLVNYSNVLREGNTLATPEVRSLVATHLHDLAVLAVGATRQVAEIANRRGLRAARVLAIRREVDRRFADPDFSLPVLAVKLGITPRYVQTLLAENDTSFIDEVIQRRLQRAHEMLCSPLYSGMTIIDLADHCGFASVSNFHRMFRRAFAATPSEVRTQALDTAARASRD
jgi:AraC-like DNA-binding protein